MKFVLGIDSGGTKYRIRAADLSGNRIGESVGPCCSHYVLGIEGARGAVEAAIHTFLASFDGKPEECMAITCGTTGWDSEEDGRIIKDVYLRLKGFSCPVICMNDVELAFYSVLGTYGVLALAGTGSILYGRNTEGEEARVGGWPKGIMGDEGSGRYIDALALQHYSRYIDGCRPASSLTDAIAEVVGGPGRKRLMDFSAEVLLPECSSCDLAPIVNHAAETGDPWAVLILKEAAGALMNPLRELITMLHMEKLDLIPVGIWGGVIMNCRIYQEEFRRLLAADYPNTVIMCPEKDAVTGAVELALKQAETALG